MATVNASGLGGLENTPLSRIGYARYVVAHGWENDFIQDITNSEWDKQLTDCNEVVQIMVEPEIGPWRKLEKAQTLVADEITPTAITMRVCNQIYKSIGFSNEDIRRACDRWPAFEASFTPQIYKTVTEIWKQFVLSRMALEASRVTKGPTAGRTCDINLGSAASPRVLTAANVHTVFSAMNRVLSEQYRWEDGKMFAVISPAERELVMNSPLFLRYDGWGDGNKNLLRDGQVPGTIMGFRIYTSNALPWANTTGGVVRTIVAGNQDAFAFVGDFVESRVVEPTNSFSRAYQTSAVYDGMALKPNALSVAQVRASV